MKVRKAVWGSGLAVALVAGMALSALGADSMPASKATAQTVDYAVLEYTAASSNSSGTTGWVPILTADLKTANQKDLFIDVSLQSALWTKTTARSKDMQKDTSSAQAGVKVRVLVDGVEASPGQVIFNDRYQQLSATLQGQLDLVDANGNGYIEEGELVVVDYEEIELLLSTVSANAFNFVMPNVSSGVHHIVVEAQIDVGTSAQAGSSEAAAVIGKGSVTIEEVRMIKDLQVELQ